MPRVEYKFLRFQYRHDLSIPYNHLQKIPFSPVYRMLHKLPQKDQPMKQKLVFLSGLFYSNGIYDPCLKTTLLRAEKIDIPATI